MLLRIAPLGTRTTENAALPQSAKPLSPILGREQDSLGCNEGLEGLMLPSIDDCKMKNSELKKPCTEDEPSELYRKSLDLVSGNVESIIGSTTYNTNLLSYGLHSNCENGNLLKLAIDENNQDNGM